MPYKLTEFSHGAGCGCKLSPAALQEILGDDPQPRFERLLVGNDTKDDAAVIDLDGQTAIVSTTDFFMPIVDDAYDFGAIAATNAISDVYAMAADPLVAIAILGWPIDKLPTSQARAVLAGARSVCIEAGIPLAGGHSIDAPEPIFGLAVTGKVSASLIKRNSDGREGDLLYLTKPLGIGIVTTAQKRKIADAADLEKAKESMLQLNKIGSTLAALPYVHALTDVTGFGLGGHLIEICEAAQLSANISYQAIPIFDFVDKYLALHCMPGGTKRNWKTYGDKFILDKPEYHRIMADPQTSGGLLISIDPGSQEVFEGRMRTENQFFALIGSLTAPTNCTVIVAE